MLCEIVYMYKDDKRYKHGFTRDIIEVPDIFDSKKEIKKWYEEKYSDREVFDIELKKSVFSTDKELY